MIDKSAFKLGAKVERMRLLPRSPANDRAYGLAVLAAVNRDNLRRLHKGMAQSWRNRSDEQVKLAYEATMRGEDIGMVDSIRAPRANSFQKWANDYARPYGFTVTLSGNWVKLHLRGRTTECMSEAGVRACCQTVDA